MTFVQNLLNLFHADKRVGLRRTHADMPEHLLNHPDIGSVIQKMSREGMP